MALEIWREGQRQKGNKAAVKEADKMLNKWGDVPVDNVKTNAKLLDENKHPLFDVDDPWRP